MSVVQLDCADWSLLTAPNFEVQVRIAEATLDIHHRRSLRELYTL
jgi:hypothetical protein